MDWNLDRSLPEPEPLRCSSSNPTPKGMRERLDCKREWAGQIYIAIYNKGRSLLFPLHLRRLHLLHKLDGRSLARRFSLALGLLAVEDVALSSRRGEACAGGLVHLGVVPSGSEKLVVSALLDEAALDHTENEVGEGDGGEAVGDVEDGGGLGGAPELSEHLTLGERIQGARELVEDLEVGVAK